LGTKISTFSKTIRVMRQKLKAAIPELWEDIKFRKEHGESVPQRRSGLHRWQGGPADFSTDRLGIKLYDGDVREQEAHKALSEESQDSPATSSAKSRRKKSPG
jgi:hypothetical protein